MTKNLTGLPVEDVQYCSISGDRVVPDHMQIYFDSLSCSLVLNNSNIECMESCGIYRMLEDKEEYKLCPDDAFRIGTLEFLV